MRPLSTRQLWQRMRHFGVHYWCDRRRRRRSRSYIDLFKLLPWLMLLTGCSPKAPWSVTHYPGEMLTFELIETDEASLAYLSVSYGKIPLYQEERVRVWVQADAGEQCYLCYPLQGSQRVLLPNVLRDQILERLNQGETVELRLEGGYRADISASGTSLRGSTRKVIGNFLPPILSSSSELSRVSKILNGTFT